MYASLRHGEINLDVMSDFCSVCIESLGEQKIITSLLGLDK